MKSAPKYGPYRPGVTPKKSEIDSIPNLVLDHDSTREMYYQWSEELAKHSLAKANVKYFSSCVLPKRALVLQIHSAHNGMFTSIGSGCCLLEWLISAENKVLCVDIWNSSDPKISFHLFPTARHALSQVQNTSNFFDGLSFAYVTHDTSFRVDPTSCLLFCWGLLSEDIAEKIIRTFVSDGGKCIVLIFDDSCCPRNEHLSFWLNHEWEECFCGDAETLLYPCKISFSKRKNIRSDF